MAQKVKVWYDSEGDFMERINKDGQVIGFSILGVGKLSKEKPLQAELVDA